MGCRPDSGKLFRLRAPCASQQGPQPQPQRHADPWPAPPSAGAGLCWCGWYRSLWRRPAWAGETHAFLYPAQRGNPFPRIGKIFPAGRRSDCCLSTPKERRKRRFPALTVTGCAARPFSSAPLKAQSNCAARWAIRAIWANARARSLRSSNWLVNASASCCKS